ncbi:MAG: nuclear transport factor 2 family protein [Bacteroidia bacterium]|nr:nuclear transport factor 2 family protein [Bacteroidia bacterium]
MIRYSFTLFLYLLFCGGIFGQNLIELEDSRFRAQMEQDTLLLAKILDADVMFIHSNAYVEDKQAFLQNVASGRIRYENMQAEEGRKILFRKRTAMSRGVLKVAGKYQGGSFDIRLRYTAVYVKKKKRWLLLNWQSTKIE